LEARRLAELTAAREAQTKAETERAQAEAQAKADKARLEAESQQAAEQARTQAAKDEAERARAATAAMRAQLLAQLNAVLQTTDSPRGLIVNMADVLFDFGKYDLKPDTKIKLAQLSGIILSHSGLNLAIEGHTDNIGSDEMNMKLSQQRADAVRGYLVQMGLKGETVTAVGLGKAGPVADNSTNAGRQQNRRVEIIVSGEIIGGKL
jgi:outer membrane protein OmpA-like peptidoglycan-associated protein